MQWTTELERSLLLNIIDVVSPSPPDWNKVSERMGITGITGEACRQKFRKIKPNIPPTDTTTGEAQSPGHASTSKASASNARPGGATASPLVVVTPRKRKPSARAALSTDEAHAVDEEVDTPTPKTVKKRKTTKVAKYESDNEGPKLSAKQRGKRAVKLPSPGSNTDFKQESDDDSFSI